MMERQDIKPNDRVSEAQKREREINRLTREIIKMSVDTIMFKLRFLDSAIYKLELKEYDGSLATDGQYLYYNHEHIFKKYREDRNLVSRELLHLILHCVFRHFFIDNPEIHRQCWDLACDIAVECMIDEMGISEFDTRKEAQKELLDEVRENVGEITAEKLYRYFVKKDLTVEQLTIMRLDFIADEHSGWYPEGPRGNEANTLDEQKKKSEGIEDEDEMDEEQKPTTEKNEDVGEGRSDESGQSDEETPEGAPKAADDVKEGLQKQMEDDVSSDRRPRDILKKEWEEVSAQIKVDLETVSRNQGYETADLLQKLKAVNRERYDYTSFLKKFAVNGEVMKVNDDEFDYIYYTYGLKVYKKMPLIEPLEYKDVKQIREFVIAIDTSASVSGDIVQRFIQKTYNVLKSTDSFFSKINLHIIQCDSEIKEAVKITNQKEFDEYLDRMVLKGFGGTDFRPVFNYVKEKIKEKEFTNLKGLIYFTDGYGVFPEDKPPFMTSFVFLRDEFDDPKVPPWVIKLVLEDDEI